MIAHSKIGASSMHRWGECPGSVALCETIPPTSSAYAEEGTAAHELAAVALESNPLFEINAVGSREKWEELRRSSPPDMLEAVAVYVDEISKLWTKARGHKDSFIMVEKRFDLSRLMPGLFGTSDCVIYDGQALTLYVIDYKHGKGVRVSPAENEQLLYYGLGAFEATGVPALKIELWIIQPRADEENPVKRWETTPYRMLMFQDELVAKAKAALSPDAPFKSGEHCRFCPGKVVCPALTKAAQEAAKSEFTPVAIASRLPAVEDSEKLAEALALADSVEVWVKAVREFAYQEARHGRPPKGFKLVEKRATRKWKSETEAADALRLYFGLKDDEAFDLSLRSVAKIEKVIGKDKMGVLEQFISKESSGDTLVPESDSRPAVNRSATAEFEKIDQP